MINEEQFFHVLLKETEEAYMKSEVYHKNKDRNWYYSICNGPIFKNKPIVFGLNWGVEGEHEPQRTYPRNIDTNTWKFKTHVNRYLPKYFGNTFDEVNYSNLCFFRTPNTKYLSYSDWRNAIPLFKRFVEYIDPPYTIMLGKPQFFDPKELTDITTIAYRPEGKKRRAFAHTGLLFEQYPFGSVPHSEAHIPPSTHDVLWKKISNLLLPLK
ncbi:hypothetical protein [Flagellimonas lutimaris]|uniref:hypothetical protein n=1 Tax=Flagellimonas lutimaris TaxID=475082 RepID=UPI003F5CDAB6